MDSLFSSGIVILTPFYSYVTRYLLTDWLLSPYLTISAHLPESLQVSSLLLSSKTFETYLPLCIHELDPLKAKKG